MYKCKKGLVFMNFNFKKYETQLVKELTQITNYTLIHGHRLDKLPASAGRVGATISDYLQDAFVKYLHNPILKNELHVSNLSDPEAAPAAKTKNPWDARCDFNFINRKENIWLDYKALDINKVDSNPDIGTPNKVIKFIKHGGFYIIFLLIYYDKDKETGHFHYVQYKHHWSNVYPLKDVSHSHTMRVNPKPQMQVNMNADPEYRTRTEFINMLCEKLKESYKRTLKRTKNKMSKLDEEREEMLKMQK